MTTAATNKKVWNTSLWIAQVVLATMFILAGIMKATKPISELSVSMLWAAAIPENLVRFIGISELLGGIGLILPSLLRVKPLLTAFCAIGLATIMITAVFFHISRGETNAIGINIVLALVSALIAWGRMKKAPIYSKSKL